MNYQEYLPSEPLQGLVKAFWTLDAEGASDCWINHQATPDGCIELILRQSGRSRWEGTQPARFAVGLNDSPITFEMSGNAKFVAVRLWPWTWAAISKTNPNSLYGRWIEQGLEATRQIYASLGQIEAVEALLLRNLGESALLLKCIGRAIVNSGSVAEMSHRTGMAPRRLQRWFGDHVGLPPRRYLRLLRFQNAFEDLSNADILADHAAHYGFADQAHMAREFRQLAGQSANIARKRNNGPFLA